MDALIPVVVVADVVVDAEVERDFGAGGGVVGGAGGVGHCIILLYLTIF